MPVVEWRVRPRQSGSVRPKLSVLNVKASISLNRKHGSNGAETRLEHRAKRRPRRSRVPPFSPESSLPSQVAQGTYLGVPTSVLRRKCTYEIAVCRLFPPCFLLAPQTEPGGTCSESPLIVINCLLPISHFLPSATQAVARHAHAQRRIPVPGHGWNGIDGRAAAFLRCPQSSPTFLTAVLLL